MSTAIFFLALAFGVGCVMFRRTFRAGRDGMAAGWAFVASASVSLIVVLAVVNAVLDIWWP
jgi:hypothetical protein